MYFFMSYKYVSLILGCLFFITSFADPKVLHKKVDKEIKDTFAVENYTFHSVKISQELKTKVPAAIQDDNLIVLLHGDRKLGYAFMDKAPSKTAEFDYLILFDTDLKIVKTKVLVYREEYGGEIGSKRWLNQFTGKSAGDELKDVVAISGATISVRSMTKAVQDALKTMEILKDNNLL